MHGDCFIKFEHIPPVQMPTRSSTVFIQARIIVSLRIHLNQFRATDAAAGLWTTALGLGHLHFHLYAIHIDQNARTQNDGLTARLSNTKIRACNLLPLSLFFVNCDGQIQVNFHTTATTSYKFKVFAKSSDTH